MCYNTSRLLHFLLKFILVRKIPVVLIFDLLLYIIQAGWNMSMLQTEDILKAVQAGMNKEEPTFSKL